MYNVIVWEKQLRRVNKVNQDRIFHCSLCDSSWKWKLNTYFSITEAKQRLFTMIEFFSYTFTRRKRYKGATHLTVTLLLHLPKHDGKGRATFRLMGCRIGLNVRDARMQWRKRDLAKATRNYSYVPKWCGLLALWGMYLTEYLSRHQQMCYFSMFGKGNSEKGRPIPRRYHLEYIGIRWGKRCLYVTAQKDAIYVCRWDIMQRDVTRASCVKLSGFNYEYFMKMLSSLFVCFYRAPGQYMPQTIHIWFKMQMTMMTRLGVYRNIDLL